MRPMIARLAAAGLAVAAVPAAAAAPVAEPAIAQSDLRHYASALLQIVSAKRIADRQWQKAPVADRPALRLQASAAIAAILARYELSPSRFNQITAVVERHPALRNQVRQRVMREGLGYN